MQISCGAPDLVVCSAACHCVTKTQTSQHFALGNHCLAHNHSLCPEVGVSGFFFKREILSGGEGESAGKRFWGIPPRGGCSGRFLFERSFWAVLFWTLFCFQCWMGPLGKASSQPSLTCYGKSVSLSIPSCFPVQPPPTQYSIHTVPPAVSVFTTIGGPSVSCCPNNLMLRHFIQRGRRQRCLNLASILYTVAILPDHF